MQILTQRKIENSWYLSKPLHQCQNLFQKQNLGYTAHFFHCICGLDETIVSGDKMPYKYCCEVCGNETFINGYNEIKGDFDITGKRLNIWCECSRDSNGFKASASIYIPISANFMRKKIIFKKHTIACYTISMNGEVGISAGLKYDLDFANKLEARLWKYIIDIYDNPHDIPILHKKWADRQKKAKAILFFLSHPRVKAFDFHYWDIDEQFPKLHKAINDTDPEEVLHYLLNGRKERSIKRALFERYEKFQAKIRYMQKHIPSAPKPNLFDPKIPFIICRCFKDPNIVSSLLLRMKILFDKSRMCSDIKLDTLIWFIIFLKRYYTEKQLATLLLKVEYDIYQWMDTLMLVSYHKHVVKKEFTKVKLSVSRLHNEIIRCSEYKNNQKIKKMNFLYTPEEKAACTEVDGILYKLPNTGAELQEWAGILHNCIAGYAGLIESGETLIYGAFRNDKLLYAIEISKGKIVERSGKYNKEINKEDSLIIDQWYKIYFSLGYRIKNGDEEN